MNAKYPAADDVREALAEVIEENRTWTRRMSDGYLSSGSNNGASIADAVFAVFEVRPRGTDWRVLGGVIPGPIPVEWVQVGDTIQDHGVTGTITRATRSGGMVHLVIGSGHVSFAKVAQQDWVHVVEAGAKHTDRSAT